MSHHYFPHTPEDIAVMLERIGVSSLDDLYSDVPESLRLKQPYNLPAPQSEKEIRDFFDTLGDHNQRLKCFAGAGYYNRYAPAVIGSLISRSEFLTAYTPYQPEISQGTLQYIFEYQTIMSRLTGLEISNASMYDGATATAEAMMMAVAHARRRNRVLVSATLNPAVREVIDTYATYHGITVDTIAEADGVTSREDFESKLAAGDVAGVIVAAPNYYGIVEDYTGWADACHAAKSLFIMNCVAIDLATIKTPGEWGADIAVGDAQSLGMPLSYGGPYLGYLCATKALMRKMPGRIVGATTDDRGNRVFVLTLQAREQHIRREKATSNICSNQGLMALYATIYTSVMGTAGLQEVNSLSSTLAHVLAEQLAATGKMHLTYPDRPFLNEFVMTVDFDLDSFMEQATDAGILPGVRIGRDCLLIAATEMLSDADLMAYVQLVKLQ
ncbi:MAG: aminomethyl-transferring glycine dehydrogenase subunit GcvPA [Muribaculaceae bacterium]|nr:aminomethyl-transferring glycine dehydrogenase subunit GcvPA [Muribaculaceae bacterium]